LSSARLAYAQGAEEVLVGLSHVHIRLHTPFDCARRCCGWMRRSLPPKSRANGGTKILPRKRWAMPRRGSTAYRRHSYTFWWFAITWFQRRRANTLIITRVPAQRSSILPQDALEGRRLSVLLHEFHCQTCSVTWWKCDWTRTKE